MNGNIPAQALKDELAQLQLWMRTNGRHNVSMARKVSARMQEIRKQLGA